MLDEAFVRQLICPETRQKLHRAEDSVIARLNEQIAQGTLKNREGQPVLVRLDGGLAREDGKILYPVRGDIPEMLIEEAIDLTSSRPLYPPDPT